MLPEPLHDPNYEPLVRAIISLLRELRKVDFSQRPLLIRVLLRDYADFEADPGLCEQDYTEDLLAVGAEYLDPEAFVLEVSQIGIVLRESMDDVPDGLCHPLRGTRRRLIIRRDDTMKAPYVLSLWLYYIVEALGER